MNPKGALTKQEIAYKFNFSNARSFKHLKAKLAKDKAFVDSISCLRLDNHLYGQYNKFSKIVPCDEIELIEKHTGVKILSA